MEIEWLKLPNETIIRARSIYAVLIGGPHDGFPEIGWRVILRYGDPGAEHPGSGGTLSEVIACEGREQAASLRDWIAFRIGADAAAEPPSGLRELHAQ